MTPPAAALRCMREYAAGVDLRQMEYFLAVVDHCGMSRAAAALRVAQPSLSQAVRKLEKDLGTGLFHRVGRGLVLSPAGEALIGPALMILRERDAALNDIRSMGTRTRKPSRRTRSRVRSRSSR